MIVQSAHDGGEDQLQQRVSKPILDLTTVFKVAYSRGPNHGGGPDKEASHYTSQSKAHGLCREDEEDLETPAEVLLIKKLLSQQNIQGVAECGTSSSHDDNDGVLLHIEWSLGVDLEVVSKQTEFPVWHESVPSLAHGIRDELNDGRRDADGRPAE